MKKSQVLHHTHLVLIDYLNEGMTTRNHKASLKERFRIMCKHYGVVSTVLRHAWFVIRALKTKSVPVKWPEPLHWNAFISSNKLLCLFTSYFSLWPIQWLLELPDPICPMQ